MYAQHWGPFALLLPPNLNFVNILSCKWHQVVTGNCLFRQNIGLWSLRMAQVNSNSPKVNDLCEDRLSGASKDVWGIPSRDCTSGVFGACLARDSPHRIKGISKRRNTCKTPVIRFNEQNLLRRHITVKTSQHTIPQKLLCCWAVTWEKTVNARLEVLRL